MAPRFEESAGPPAGREDDGPAVSPSATACLLANGDAVAAIPVGASVNCK